jgi:hypothetical protein
LFVHKKLETAKETEKIGEIKEVKYDEYPSAGFFWFIEIKDSLKIYKANFY